MKLSKGKSLLVATCVTAAAGVLPLVAAAPASASASSCRAYVAAMNYDIGPKVKRACNQGRIVSPLGNKIMNPACYSLLVQAGVSGGIASVACNRA